MIVKLSEQPNTNVTVTITSCGRFDLLKQTIDSLLRTVDVPVKVKIYDDSASPSQQTLILNEYGDRFDLYLVDFPKGQAYALDFIYSKVDTYWLFHCEDDWEFIKPGYLTKSAKILYENPNIEVVGLALTNEFVYYGASLPIPAISGEKVYEHPHWRIDENHGFWHGWIGSPNLKRTWNIRNLFPKFSSVMNEEDWDRLVFAPTQRKSIWLFDQYVNHIGDNRSTFPVGDMLRRDWRRA